MIARIRTVALETPGSQPKELLLNTSVIAEVLLPRCLEVVTERVSKTPDGLTALRGEATASFTDGVANLPATLKAEYVDMMTFKDDPACSYVPSWHEFQLHPEPGEVPMDYSRFHINNNQIHYHRYDEVKNGYTGDAVIIGILKAALPSSGAGEVTLSDSVVQKLVVMTAAVINGQVGLREIGLDYGSLEQVRKQSI